MELLSPLGLAWLASLPVLVWLWRFAASRHQTLLPSLVPFEHLLRRPPTRRTHLLVNLLFWLQAAALILIACALAEPVLVTRHAKTVLVVWDTSASMGASTGRASAFQQAKRTLLSRISHQHPGERFFIVTSAPIRALSPDPLAEATTLRQLVQRVRPSDLGGNLSVTFRMAQALLGARADETLVLTDEPRPGAPAPGVEWRTFDEPLPNVAVVGVDAHEALCTVSDAKLVVSVQQFADRAQDVTVTVRHRGRRLGQQTQTLEPQARVPFTVGLPEEAAGVITVQVAAAHNALSVDDRAAVRLLGSERLPLLLASAHSDFVQTVGEWLAACPKIAWEPVALDPASPTLSPPTSGMFAGAVLVTDELSVVPAWPASALVFIRGPSARRVMLTQWLVDPTHTIGEYLDPVEAVATTVTMTDADLQWGDPVIWGVVEGRKIPLVQAATTQGWRSVSILSDPTASARSVPLVMVFLNSLRWVTGTTGQLATGEPLLGGSFAPGLVRVQRPDGSVDIRGHQAGLFRYDDTDQAGRYHVTQGSVAVDALVNFFDPVESNTWQRLSTWSAGQVGEAAAGLEVPPRLSLAGWLVGLVLALLLGEWACYLWKSAGAGPAASGLRLPSSSANDRWRTAAGGGSLPSASPAPTRQVFDRAES